ncbi:DUF1697 domain-containing protein [Pengzhenrongella sicca]|uniref:DUF1697 domain-containing protein n=1 Tax=Pengzhenrongella sicca TaxID=2819238 RepID=A0A8A4ZCW5_9MICO|nr:DUF1697 domain-containing protein [Pengzhenrongella sicca]QTE29261.1 DUF1697 domain-containing protein [Pengzhenrongella sicca]
MRTHVALLRGVNVGGHGKLAMPELREIAVSLGFRNVATYIQSGNLVFASSETSARRLAARLEEAVAERTTASPGVVVLARAELAQVVAGNPYPGEADPKHVHVTFHSEVIGPDGAAAGLAAADRARELGSRDELAVVGSCLYLHTPDGLGRSVLAAQLARPQVGRAMGQLGTARNWSTVLALLALLDE